MMYWDGAMGVWWYVLMGLGFVLFWGAIITGIILVARSVTGGNHRYDGAPERKTPEDLLAERFARGDIDESEFNARLAVLRRRQGG